MNEAKRVGIGVGVMILQNGRILLGRRHGNPAKAGSALHGEGTWTMPGGKVEFGEELEETCIREVFEETGLTIDKTSLKLISVANDKVADAHFVTLGFLCESVNGNLEVREPDEITEWGWFPINQLPQPMFFCSAEVVNNYLADKIY